MDAETPKVGDRRPREGRCERCDRPLTDEVWTTWVSREQELRRIWFPASSDETHCVGGISCRESPIDWRARALAAEAVLAAAEASGRQHGLLAGAMRLFDLAECSCSSAWTGRHMHSPDCAEWMIDELAALSTAAKETP